MLNETEVKWFASYFLHACDIAVMSKISGSAAFSPCDVVLHCDKLAGKLRNC